MDLQTQGRRQGRGSDDAARQQQRPTRRREWPPPPQQRMPITAAETWKAVAAGAATEAKLLLEPVSIYISLATQKLYVRRNTHAPARDGGGEVFDSSIEAADHNPRSRERIGTHIFTAVAGTTDSGIPVDRGHH